jgi:hypothetical protein
MARLTAKTRKALPSSTFAGQNRSFPIPDKAHARAALQDLPKTNKLDAQQKDRVRSRAEAKLGRLRGGVMGR